MKKENIFTGGKQKNVKQNYFTGPARIKEFSKSIQSLEQNVYHVTFRDGAITKLHFHEGGQILIVTKGRGKLTIYKKIGSGKTKFKIKKNKEVTLQVGDISYVPPKILHTHGSDKKGIFSHIAINAYPAKNREPKTIWFESDFKTEVTKTI